MPELIEKRPQTGHHLYPKCRRRTLACLQKATFALEGWRQAFSQPSPTTAKNCNLYCDLLPYRINAALEICTFPLKYKIISPSRNVNQRLVAYVQVVQPFTGHCFYEKRT
ncbi:hypothetical protein AVEN_118551-1 [Araneus ventricosus]|uniref:Uncharacterized protein n=1 Tax=Araneus ventricosus TaxID=182803 RepID=A0A4Y2AYG6_ARAVE|nr:hypothetical protein AVEN_118551-1 [Araneus ventricosus]